MTGNIQMRANGLVGTASFFIAFLLMAGGSAASAQGLSPTAPTKEFVYFGGLLVAVEERGPGGNQGAVKTPTAPTATSSAPATPTTTNAVVPPMPKPTVPPQDTTSNLPRLSAPPR